MSSLRAHKEKLIEMEKMSEFKLLRQRCKFAEEIQRAETKRVMERASFWELEQVL